MSEKIAIIDLGTNTFHLLIAETTEGSSHILHREKQPVKIGMGGINQGHITEAAIQRALTCLHKFKKTMDERKVSRSLAFGTSALRSASNGADVVQQIEKETGIQVQLISGDAEAEYIFYGIQSAMDLGLEKSMIVDIGGGSVEFIIGNRSQLFWKHSFDLGAQRLLERFQKHDPILPSEIKTLEDFFESSLPLLADAIQIHHPSTLIGSSGTFDTLSEIYCIQQGIPFSHEDPETPLAHQAFSLIHEELISKNRADRLQIQGMIEMRVDMIVVASCLVNYLLKRFSFKKIRVSSWSMKEGVLAKYSGSIKTMP
ncbi:MAG TPA: exopolyphosphatase [Cyclobacteriaceae bacterium]|nr:exopolyphosphatase [Cyclobacteriaceae bacterium]